MSIKTTAIGHVLRVHEFEYETDSDICNDDAGVALVTFEGTQGNFRLRAPEEVLNKAKKRIGLTSVITYENTDTTYKADMLLDVDTPRRN